MRIIDAANRNPFSFLSTLSMRVGGWAVTECGLGVDLAGRLLQRPKDTPASVRRIERRGGYDIHCMLFTAH